MRTTGRWEAGDPGVDAFVEASIGSFAAWDLVIYLNRNPEASEPISRLAVILARQESDLLPAVRKLAETGVLVEAPQGDQVHYQLTDDGEIRDVISRFISLAARREYRLEYVRRVLAHLT